MPVVLHSPATRGLVVALWLLTLAVALLVQRPLAEQAPEAPSCVGCHETVPSGTPPVRP